MTLTAAWAAMRLASKILLPILPRNWLGPGVM
jgi:hypothetical protein